MIIYNNKGRASNFIKNGTDTRVFDVHASISIEELYDYLIHHDDIPESVEVHQYNTHSESARFATVAPMDDNILTEGTVRLWSSFAEDSDTVSQMEAMKAARRTAASNADYIRLESLFNGFGIVGPDQSNSMAFGSFREVDVNRNELVSHLADSLGIYPTLHTDTEVSLEEKQALGKAANRLRWTFTQDEDYAVVPPIEMVKLFESLDKYEKSLIADSLFFPGDMLRNAYAVKQAHSSFIITPDNTNTNSHIATASDEFLELCKTKFEEKFNRAPRVLKEYVEAQMSVGVTYADEIVNGFSLNSLKAVAQKGSPVLFALVPYIDFSQCKQEQIYFLATHLYYLDLRSLISHGFGQWFSKHRNESLADLTELLISYRPDAIGTWNLDLTSRQIIEEIKTRKGREDCAKYERHFHYHFSDNEVAIRGKGLVVKDGAFTMHFLPKDDYRNFTVGYDTVCCQHWNGAGGSCVYKYTTDPFAACVVIERAGKVVAQSFVFTDELNDTFVFDNIEFANDRVVADYADIIATFVKEIPYKNVHMGTGYTEGQYRTWGQSLGSGRFNMAQMPTTLDRTHIYTDYHANARVFKADDMMFIRQGNCKVEHLPEEPTRWDALRDSGAKVLLNDCSMSVADRLAFSGRGIDDIGVAHRLQLLLDYPILADSMDSVPEEWQRRLIENRVNPKLLQYIKNPIQEVRNLVLPKIPGKALVWTNLTREDWTLVLCNEPSIISKCPFELDADMARTIYDSCGDEALPYIPMSLLNEELLCEIVNRNPRTLLSIREPSEDLIVAAVTRQPLLLSALPIITDRVGMAAVESMPASIIYWVDAPFSVCEDAVRKQPSLIRNLAHRFPVLRETAIQTDPDSVWSIPDATEEEFALSEHIKVERTGEQTPPPELPTDAILGQFD